MMRIDFHRFLGAAILWVLLASCGNIVGPNYTGSLRSFQSSLESDADFQAFYIENAANFGSAQSYVGGGDDPVAVDGSKIHKAWILKANDSDNNSTSGYKPHRAYPTIQLQKTSGGIYRTPCLVTFYVWLDVPLQSRSGINDWVSLATLTPDSSDQWVRVVVANVTVDGYFRLVHVPNQGEQIYTYQAGADNDPGKTKLFPWRKWVRVDIFIDFDETRGSAKLWQNQVLVSQAQVRGGRGALAQAHFGLYAGAALGTGRVYNDKLRIREITGEAAAQALVDEAY
ncbi:MAG: polysaccharide lyase [Spirochaetia bacterium]|nr:polysaccharide lyase [Spirochaetia bacterium]